MFPSPQDHDTEGVCPLPINRTLQCVPHLLSHTEDTVMLPLPPSGHCDMFSPTFEMLRCILLPPQKTVMCVSQLSGCYDALLRLRMMPCVLHHAKVAAQAIRAKKVDQHPCPQPEEDAHALEEAAQLLPHTVVLPFPQSEKLKVFPSLLGSNAMCDGLLVTDDKKDKQLVFSSSLHILRRFFSPNCLSSLHAPPTPPSYSSTPHLGRACLCLPLPSVSSAVGCQSVGSQWCEGSTGTEWGLLQEYLVIIINILCLMVID